LILLKRKGSGEKAGGVRRVQRRLDPGRLKPIPRGFETDRYADAAKANDFASSIKVR
jgi:hypothetical protein